MTHPDTTALDSALESLALDVTGGDGSYVSAFVHQFAASDRYAVEDLLIRLRERLPANRDVRLRVEWVRLTGRDVLMFVMGAPS
jgi:hypothetical protein